MKRILIMLLFLFACTVPPPLLLSQWITQNSGTTQHLYDVFFIDINTGWACGNNGTILKTTNGGFNWFPLNSGIIQPIESIHFINANMGWAGSRIIGKIIKTTDGGNTWIQQFESSNTSIYSIYFLDNLLGWTTGAGVPFETLRSTNGGATWDSTDVSTGFGNHIFFINSQTGWVCIGSQIHKSSNGGITWDSLFSTIGFGEIAQFSFVNASTGWLVTSSSYRVYKTINGGINWQFLDTLLDCFNAHSIQFTSLNTGWVSGDCGQIFKTTNGGFNWNQQNTQTSNFLNSVYFVNDSVGWSVGGGGIIIHTSNGGSILPVISNQNETPKNHKLYQNYPNPFNPITHIKFQISIPSNVMIKIYDILGKETTILFNEKLISGTYEIEFEASKLSSGIYFYSLIIDDAIFDSKKLFLLK